MPQIFVNFSKDWEYRTAVFILLAEKMAMRSLPLRKSLLNLSILELFFHFRREKKNIKFLSQNWISYLHQFSSVLQLNTNSTDDDARKAMRLDGSKLKEIQVRLFLSSRAEMQEVIESARQTTMSLMQMQQQPSIARPIVANVPPPVLTPQSPPQTNLATAIQQKLPPTQLSGLLTQQMYQQQLQQLQQQVKYKRIKNIISTHDMTHNE